MLYINNIKDRAVGAKQKLHSIFLKIISQNLNSCIPIMSDFLPTRTPPPHLGDEDLIWKILVKADPKMVGRCMTVSRAWNFKLCTPTFVKENYKENKERNKSVIIGIGYPPSNQNSLWFIRAFVDDGRQVQFNVPMDINQFGFYAVIGSDHGNICLRISMGGLNSRLLIWNPLTSKR
ncbi:hypothetical protein HN51_057764 [Arachis hypogaea]